MEHSEKILSLSEKINNISRQESTNSIEEQCLTDLLESPFYFTFSVINIIDPYNRRVIKWLPKTIDTSKVNPKIWRDEIYHKDESIRILSGNDIICVVFETGNVYKVINKNVELIKGEKVFEVTLDKRLFDKFDHDKLTRVYLPLRSLTKSKEEFTFGVIEMGFLTNDAPTIIDEKLIEDIQVYVDNVGQVYHKIFLEEQKESLEEQIANLYHIKDHKDYLSKVLEYLTVNFSNSKYGEVDIITCNDDENTWIPSEESVRFNISDDWVLNGRLDNIIDGKVSKKGIYRHALLIKKTYNCANSKNDPYYISSYPFVKSQLSIPFSTKGKYIGVLSLYSEHRNFYNFIKIELLEEIVDTIADTYLRKKANKILSDLILPLNIFRNKREIFRSSIAILRNYVLSDYISIVSYEKEENNTNIYYINNENFSSTPIGDKNQVKKSNITIKLTSENLDFLFKNPIYKGEFKTEIFIPILYGNERFGFIQILSKREIEHLFYEDQIFYSQMSAKLGMTLHFLEFFTAFIKMPTLLAQKNPESIYNAITQRCKDFFNADLVLLFSHNIENRYGLSDVHQQGDLLMSTIKKQKVNELENIDMVHFTIEKRTIYIENQAEYEANWSSIKRDWKSDTFGEDFWHREKIKSFASITLELDNQDLGVLFLNYRKENQIFDDYFKNKLSTFSALSSQAIAYAKLYDENKHFNQKNIELQKSFIENFVIAGIAHNTKNSVDSAIRRLEYFIKELEKLGIETKKKNKDFTIDINWVLDKFNLIKSPLEDIGKANQRLRDFQNNDGRQNYEITDIKNFINDTVNLFLPKAVMRDVSVDCINNISQNINIEKIYLQQALLNLLVNALESIVDSKNKKGKIRIESKYARNKTFLLINVSDNGGGIDDKDRAKIFSPYFTTKSYGTGVGLPSTRYIVEEFHNGRIDFFVERDETKWTTFSISLPLTIK